MNTSAKSILAGVLAMGAVVSLQGCVVAPHPYGHPSATVIVPVAPPPNRVEVIGVAPFPGAVWISGRWVWHDQWNWHRGYWSKPPRHGQHWQRGRWEPYQDKWRWQPGGWR